LEETKVRRQLGAFDATMLVMGGIVGSGIFMNPSVVARQVHTPFLILGVWVAGGALALLGAFIWAELATRLPGAGGQYLYLREAYHPAVAFVYGWVALWGRPVSLGLLGAIGAASIPVAFAYGGWQTATFVAGEMRNPARDLSRGLVAGVAGVGVL